MKSKIPKFKSLEEERRFWQTHDTAEFWEELTPVKIRFSAPRRPAISIHLTGQEFRVLQGLLARLTHSHLRSHTSTRPHS